MKNVVVIGRGAVGAIYALAFSRCTDVRLRVAVGVERIEKYRREPFFVNGERADFEYFTPTEHENVDLIIIATKWSGYSDAMQMTALLTGDRTQILPLLNGLMAYDQAVERFGVGKVLRGYFFGHTASKSDTGVHQDGSYRTVFGEDHNVEGSYSDRVEAIVELFDRGKVKYRIDENMITSQWQKFVINVGTNQVTALDGGLKYSEMLSSEKYMALSVALMNEAVAVAAAEGVEGSDLMVSKALEAFKVMRGVDYSSMAQDVLAGRETEIAMFAGEIVRMGRLHSIATPENARLLSLIF